MIQFSDFTHIKKVTDNSVKYAFIYDLLVKDEFSKKNITSKINQKFSYSQIGNGYKALENFQSMFQIEIFTNKAKDTIYCQPVEGGFLSYIERSLDNEKLSDLFRKVRA